MKFNDITSLTHPLVKHLVKLRTNREYRYQQGSVLVTGPKLIREIVADVRFKVICIEKDFPISFKIPNGVELVQVSHTIIKKISGLVNPEPLLAEVEMPSLCDLSNKKFILVLDGISDPGNMGTLIRSALALNWEGVFIGPNCTDPFNDKAIRAAKGATFRIPIFSGTWEDLTKIAESRSMNLYLAAVDGTPFEGLTYAPPCALILSNESKGASEEAQVGSRKISIPMHHMDSLNVASAGSILMYHLRHRL